ncbi:MAG: hypothetical protein WDW20_04700 [Neisseriaceae bacterium]
MKTKQIYGLSLVGLLVFAVLSGCKDKSTESSVSLQQLETAKEKENITQLAIEDKDAKQEVQLFSQGSYRVLDERQLKAYNRTYHSFKTMKYFYDDNRDISVAVTKVGPIHETVDIYLKNLQNKIKTAFPTAEYEQGLQSKQIAYAKFAYLDTKKKLNNACQVILTTDGKLAYTACAISPTQSISELKEEVKKLALKSTVNVQ